MNNDTPKASNIGKLLLILVLVVIVAVGAWYLYSKHNGGYSNGSSQTASSRAPIKWGNYVDKKYRVSFDYPTNWGNPVIRETRLQTGKHYNISFMPSGQSQPQFAVVVSLDSNDAKATNCQAGGKCVTTGGVTKSFIEEQLKLNKSQFTVSDSTSYAIVTNLALQKVGGVSVYQIVELPQLNVSAAMASYQLLNTPTNCPAHDFSNSKGCIARSDFDTLSRVLKSLKSF